MCNWDEYVANELNLIRQEGSAVEIALTRERLSRIKYNLDNGKDISELTKGYSDLELYNLMKAYANQ